MTEALHHALMAEAGRVCACVCVCVCVCVSVCALQIRYVIPLLSSITKTTRPMYTLYTQYTQYHYYHYSRCSIPIPLATPHTTPLTTPLTTHTTQYRTSTDSNVSFSGISTASYSTFIVICLRFIAETLPYAVCRRATIEERASRKGRIGKSIEGRA